MIKLDDIQTNKALKIVKNYEGPNPYITHLRRVYERDGKLALTTKQEKYITTYKDVEPQHIGKVLHITDIMGGKLKTSEELSFVPERIYFDKIISDDGKLFLILGKVKKNQKKNQFYWIPKKHVIDDPYYNEEDYEVDVDFTKYGEIDELDRELYEHQKEAVKFLIPRKGAILAHDMGLGKSLSTVVSALEMNPDKVLIICPSGVKISWKRELENLGEKDISVVSGSIWNENKFTIINYDILKNFHTPKKDRKNMKKGDIANEIVDAGFDIVIVDEAHRIKNAKSKRGKIVREVCNESPNVFRTWLLTGTPITNRPMDYFNLLRTIGSDLSQDWKFFAERYCKAFQIEKGEGKKKKKIWITDGASNLDELSYRTSNIILRRKKEDVLDLPDKIVTPLVHELDQNQLTQYESLWDDYLQKRKEEGKKGTPSKDLVELLLLREFIANQAVPYTVEKTEDILSENEENKVVIFTSFDEEQQYLAEKLGNKCVVHNGKMSDTNKQKSIDKFQNEKDKRVFIGNINSAGVGITLTSASFIIFNSFSWVPGDNEQAEDRCYRIGQQNNVNIYYNLFKDTISEYMWGVLKNKKKVINRLLNENNNEYERILEEIKNEYADE